MAHVSAIYKKGDVTSCGNYRPISLLCVTYKILAALLLGRLRQAGAEDRITKTQFGFRRARGTTDAVFAARRYIEAAHARKNGKALLLALDWKAAFDAINPDALVAALIRFGVGDHLAQFIGNLYRGRTFRVCDAEAYSEVKQQNSGISQGCPLSPFLFIILMTVVMADAVREVPEATRKAHEQGSLSALLYADDTLLVGDSAEHVQNLLLSVAEVGKRYGMELHWDKFQFLRVGEAGRLFRPDGSEIEAKGAMKYLGAILNDAGDMTSEMSQKLGLAWADFRKLARMWNHSGLGTVRKCLVFNSVIVSRLLYGLSSAWLNKADVRRLNGFQARCLRKILRVAPSYYSRISNRTVLERAQQEQLSEALLKQQLMLFGRVARAESNDVIRQLVFVGGTLWPMTDTFVRRRGRPKNEWTKLVRAEAFKLVGQEGNLEQSVQDQHVWKMLVNKGR